MGKKAIIRRSHRRPAKGDLRHRVTIQNRNIMPPDDAAFDPDLKFTTHKEVWAGVTTVSGETLFDGVGQDDVVSHTVTIRFIEGVTAESWILLKDGTRLDILAIENLEERNEWIIMMAQRTGLATDEASKA